MKIKKKQELTKKWFIKLQNKICENIEQLEKKYVSNKKENEMVLFDDNFLKQTCVPAFIVTAHGKHHPLPQTQI